MRSGLCKRTTRYRNLTVALACLFFFHHQCAEARAQQLKLGASGWGAYQQAMCVVINESAIQQLSKALLDFASSPGVTEATLNGSLATLTQYNMQSGTTSFGVSGLSSRKHNGFRGHTARGNFATPGFQSDSYGGTVGTRFDGSALFGLTPDTLTLGVFGNYTQSDLTLGVSPAAAQAGLNKSARGEMESYGLGSYALLTAGQFYGLGIFSHAWSTPEVENYVNNTTSRYDARSISWSGNVGMLFPLGQHLTADLRGGLTFNQTKGDDYRDYTNSYTHDLGAIASAKVFFKQSVEGVTLRPFVQGGVSQRLHYRNEITYRGVDYKFDEDGNTGAFGRTGIDWDFGMVQSYIAVGGDVSASTGSFNAQMGVTFKLD